MRFGGPLTSGIAGRNCICTVFLLVFIKCQCGSKTTREQTNNDGVYEYISCAVIPGFCSRCRHPPNSPTISLAPHPPIPVNNDLSMSMMIQFLNYDCPAFVLVYAKQGVVLALLDRAWSELGRYRSIVASSAQGTCFNWEGITFEKKGKKTNFRQKSQVKDLK